MSVIITNFNYAQYIQQALQSVLVQDYDPIEIIIVDDGSTDNSIEVINRVEGTFQLLTKSNGGVSSARNAGMAIAKGDFVAFLDADDFWLPNKVSSQILDLNRTGTELNYCQVRHFNENDPKDWLSSECRTGEFNLIFLDNPGRTPFAPSSVILSKKLIKEVGDWDVRLKNAAEDYDYFRRASKFTKFSFTPKPLVAHREHLNSLTSGPLTDYFLYNHMAFVKAYLEDREINSIYLNRKRIFKFQSIFLKSFLKKKDFNAAWKLFVSIFQSEENFLELELL